jgi:biofilm protein TabA
MILCPISQFHRYAHLHPGFPAVARFLTNADLGAFPEGRTDLQGDDLYVSSSPQARKRPTAPLEAHRAYIDVQVILEDTDTMGWAPLEACREESAPYDPDKDIVFFRDAAENLVTVRAGQLIIFFPEDAHAPLIGEGGTVQKLVLKVREAWHPKG